MGVANVVFGLMAGLAGGEQGPQNGREFPPLRREFRGVWVATVANIDWPSSRRLPVAQQKKELLAILDRAVELGLNAIVLQVRPMCDALYDSKLEPWSEYLTGKAGQPPAPYYDPLAFAIAESHRRGLELHAWVNPYRAQHPSATSALPAEHIVRRRPDLAKPYGRYYWLDPGEPDALRHSLDVIDDIVRRYDVDGMHIDDYFYPYKERDAQKQILPFPDDASWQRYLAAGGKLRRDDWRRDNVDRFVKAFYKAVKARKPWVKVGISPFGIWRPGHPPGIEGFDQYAELYADARLWLQKGWCDYFTPQLYWPIRQEKQSYPKLLSWWLEQNAQGRHVWPGNAAYRAGSSQAGWSSGEIAEQIAATRRLGAGGNIHFSMKSLVRQDSRVAESLQRAYAEPALVPASPWLFAGDPPPVGPVKCGADAATAATIVTWSAAAAGTVARYAVYLVKADGSCRSVLLPPRARPSYPIERADEFTQVAVSAIDRFGREGPKTVVALPSGRTRKP